MTDPKDRRLWVVESFFDDQPEVGWLPTVAVGLDRDMARFEARCFKRRNSGLRTRVRCYVPEEKR